VEQAGFAVVILAGETQVIDERSATGRLAIAEGVAVPTPHRRTGAVRDRARGSESVHDALSQNPGAAEGSSLRM